MCANAARMLWLTGPNQRAGRCVAIPSTSRLASAPDRLRKNPGARNWPSSRLPASTRSSDTHTASRQPQRASTTRVTMLASPGLIPGSGSGIAASATVSTIAAAAWRAMRRSSLVGVSSIVEGVIVRSAAGEAEADLVGRADRHRAGLRQPALAHAILARPGVGSDARAPGPDLDHGDTERTGHLDQALAGEIDLGHHPPPGAHHRAIGRAALPQAQHRVRAHHQAEHDHDDIARTQQ